MKTVQIDMQQVEKIIHEYLIACAGVLKARESGDEYFAKACGRTFEIHNAKIVTLVKVGVITWEEYYDICKNIRKEL